MRQARRLLLLKRKRFHPRSLEKPMSGTAGKFSTPDIRLLPPPSMKKYLLQFIDYLKLPNDKSVTRSVSADVVIGHGSMDGSTGTLTFWSMRSSLKDNDDLLLTAVPPSPPPAGTIVLSKPEWDDLTISIRMGLKEPEFIFNSSASKFDGRSNLKLSNAGSKGGVIYGQIGPNAMVATVVIQKIEEPIIK